MWHSLQSTASKLVKHPNQGPSWGSPTTAVYPNASYSEPPFIRWAKRPFSTRPRREKGIFSCASFSRDSQKAAKQLISSAVDLTRSGAKFGSHLQQKSDNLNVLKVSRLPGPRNLKLKSGFPMFHYLEVSWPIGAFTLGW